MRRLLALGLVLLLAAPAWAQIASGNIYGTVTDESGAVLPGASVSAVSKQIGGAPRTTLSGSKGEFRFLNLDRGVYTVSVNMSGFGPLTREVIVTTGVNVELKLGLKVAGKQESVTVTAETPVVDTKRVGTATTLSEEELTKVPQGRDPWAVLKTVPGILVDRVSIAGNEAGQQSIFVGKGAQFADTMWNLDGVVITDTTSGGATSTYFDFDAFQEIAVTTGGNDLKTQTGGLGLNFVTKRGTNTFHGSVRTFFSHDKLQSSNLPDSLKNDSRLALRSGGFSDNADHIDQINDYGADLGGPLIKDKLWFWGSYGKNDIRLVRFNQTKDKTLLKNWNAKLNWNAGSRDQLSFFFFNGAKVKLGRSPGFAGNEPDSFLWNQGNFYPESDCKAPCGLHGLFKLEENHTFNANFFMNAKYAYYGWGYGFDPRGGNDKNGGVDRVTDTAYGSSTFYRFTKPWHIFDVSGSAFKNGWGGNHEFKFGFGYRYNPNDSLASFSGDGLFGVRNSTDPSDPAASVAFISRPYNSKFTGKSASGYVGDTFTKGRWTWNLGVRWDRQQAETQASTAPANPAFPNLMPALQFQGGGTGVDWKDFSPRVGFTVALDENRKTVARASYARYAGQLNPLEATYDSPIPYGYAYLAYKWVDRNGDHLAQRDEILATPAGFVYAVNVDPSNPAALSSFNKIDPNYHANKDNEVVVGIDHELGKNLAVGAAYTWRRTTDLPSWAPRIDANGRILTQADYIANAPVSANGFTAQSYFPNPARIGNNGSILTNRPDYHQTYSGFELSANKRLANKWFARAAFSVMDWTEHFDGPNAIQNPTKTDLTGYLTAGAGPSQEGGIVAPKSYGAKTNTFFNAKWQFSLNALYQFAKDMELGAALFGRQGYPRALYLRLPGGDDGAQRAIPAALDSQRFKNVWNLDLRLARHQKLGGRAMVDLSVDLFNVFNTNVVLQQSRQVNAASFNRIDEIINPRILRIGVRLGF